MDSEHSIIRDAFDPSLRPPPALDSYKNIGQEADCACSRCGATLGVSWADSRTMYHWDGNGLNPNAPVPLCPECTEDHDDYWDEMWSNVGDNSLYCPYDPPSYSRLALSHNPYCNLMGLRLSWQLGGNVGE